MIQPGNPNAQTGSTDGPPPAPSEAIRWAQRLTALDWPVLQESADFLALASQNHRLEDAHTLSEQIDQDPLLVLKVLAYVAQVQIAANREPTAQTPLECVLLAGVNPFLSRFGRETGITEPKVGASSVQEGSDALAIILKRTRHAAQITRAVAICRQDPQAAKLYTAAQVYAAPELLFCVCGFKQHHDCTTATSCHDDALQSQIERIAYGTSLEEIRAALVAHLALPKYFQTQAFQTSAEHTCLVHLAHKIAAHGAQGISSSRADAVIQKMARLLSQPVSDTRIQMQDFCDD